MMQLRCGLLLAAGVFWRVLPGQAQAARPVPDAPSDDQSYRREVVFGVNFNTQGGLLGGVNFRISRVLDSRWLRYWGLEGVAFKNTKEQRVTNQFTGGSFVAFKVNHALALRPSFGVQRILFRKAPEAGVQVNALLSAGPSLGLLMPYHISYDYTAPTPQQILATDDIRDEAFDPARHDPNFIVDSGPLFGGLSDIKPVLGFHLRGGLSFEYGRYRDAYTKQLTILDPGRYGDVNQLNKKFFPSVYLTLYLGHRS